MRTFPIIFSRSRQNIFDWSNNISKANQKWIELLYLIFFGFGKDNYELYDSYLIDTLAGWMGKNKININTFYEKHNRD